MNRETEIIRSRETSPLQRRLNEIAHLQKLEEEGIHTDSLIKREDPTFGKVIFTRAISQLHKRITAKSH